MPHNYRACTFWGPRTTTRESMSYNEGPTCHNWDPTQPNKYFFKKSIFLKSTHRWSSCSKTRAQSSQIFSLLNVNFHWWSHQKIKYWCKFLKILCSSNHTCLQAVSIPDLQVWEFCCKAEPAGGQRKDQAGLVPKVYLEDPSNHKVLNTGERLTARSVSEMMRV